MYVYYIHTYIHNIIMFAANISYLMICSHMVYKISLFILNMKFHTDLQPDNRILSFEHFSLSWVTIFCAIFLTSVCMIRDKSVFNKIAGKGAFFIMILVTYIVYTGFKSFTNTKFMFTTF